MEAELLHADRDADGQTDRHNEANSRLSGNLYKKSIELFS